ncbi:MAG: NAD(P)/FAD-dependent oxidoreductase, partial [Chitinophagaceae bacterium]
MNIIIVGAGFAGLKLARALNNQKGVSVTLLDKNNFHQFQPLFYQVATAGLDASNISFPLRKIFQGSKNVQVRMGELLEIHSNKNEIVTSIGTFQYDLLVLAMGANTNFFGNKQLEKWAFPMKTTVEALNIKYQLLQNLENALS